MLNKTGLNYFLSFYNVLNIYLIGILPVRNITLISKKSLLYLIIHVVYVRASFVWKIAYI